MRHQNDVIISGEIVDFEERSDDTQSWFTLKQDRDELLRVMCINELSSEVLNNITPNTKVIVLGHLLFCSTCDIEDHYAYLAASTIITEDGEVYTGEEDIFDVLKYLLKF